MISRSTGKSAYSDNKVWLKHRQTRISDTTEIYEFTNDNYKMNTFYKGTEFFGKHYLVTFNNKSRNYTNCTSLSVTNINYRANLINAYYKEVLNKDASYEDNFYDESIFYTDSLPLVLKTYEGKGGITSETPLSWNMKNADVGTEWIIDGPFGKGLELTPESCGNYVLLSAGTGFLPFADLLDFLLKKAIYMAAKKNGNEKMASMVQPQQDYEKIFKNATFSFYGAFSTLEDFTMREVIEELHSICTANDFTWFKTAIRMSKRKPKGTLETLDMETPTKQNLLGSGQKNYASYDKEAPFGFPAVKEYFDNVDFLKRACPKGSTIFICGPPTMNCTIYKNLRDIGFEDYDVYLI